MFLYIGDAAVRGIFILCFAIPVYTNPSPQEYRDTFIDDILPSKRENPGFKTQSRSISLWENGLVPFIVSEKSGFSEENRRKIQHAMEEIQNRSCVRFVRHTKEADYVSFLDGDGCESYVGRQEGMQVVILNKHKCLEHGTILHEILHSLGLQHEQNRSDRNRFVTILWGNVNPNFIHNFDRFVDKNVDSLGLPYDYSSIMHYSNEAMQKKRKYQTILPLRRRLSIGHEKHLSYYDLLKINLLYHCKM